MNTDTEILNKMIQAIQNYIGTIKDKNYGNVKNLQKKHLIKFNTHS